MTIKIKILLSLFMCLCLNQANALREVTCPCHSATGVREGNTTFDVCASGSCSSEEMRKEIDKKYSSGCINDFGGKAENYRLDSSRCQVL